MQTETKSIRLRNILLIALLVIALAILALQVWHMVDGNRPVIRPHVIPTKTPKLPDAWYQKYKNPEACNYYVTS